MTNDMYGVLGNEIRVKLLLCLFRKAKNVSELIENCGLSQSAVSQHLTKLKQAHLVETTKQGKEVRYSLKNKKIATVCRLLVSLQKERV